jgi:hypothetical protein
MIPNTSGFAFILAPTVQSFCPSMQKDPGFGAKEPIRSDFRAETGHFGAIFRNRLQFPSLANSAICGGNVHEFPTLPPGDPHPPPPTVQMCRRP